MEPIRTVKLRWLHGALGEVTYQLTRAQFSHLPARTWRPAVNIYRCENCLRVCVDLAGVEKALLDLTVEPRRLIVRGSREVPEPAGADRHAMQMLAMEIDYGPFEREVLFSVEIDVAKVRAEQQNGLLWIILPIK